MIIVTNLENETFIQWESNHWVVGPYKGKRLLAATSKAHRNPKPKFKKQHCCRHVNIKCLM